MRKRFQPGFYGLWIKMAFNGILHAIAKRSPGGVDLRPFLHRLRGVKIYGKVFIGDDVYLDADCPETIEIHDGAVIAARCTLIGHTRGPGKIVIGKGAAIAAGCVIVCSEGQTLTIGEGAVLSAGSTVTHDIPPYTLCANPRIKAYAQVTVPFNLGTPYEDFKRGLRPLRPRGERKDKLRNDEACVS